MTYLILGLMALALIIAKTGDALSGKTYKLAEWLSSKRRAK